MDVVERGVIESIRPHALPSLTGLRWLAAVTVFVHHLRNLGYFRGDAQEVLTVIFGAGATAVSLFFVLSGFVLVWSYREGTSTATTWWHRFIRIYPMHVVGFALAAVVSFSVYPAIRTSSVEALWANLLLVSSWRADWWQAGNPVSWSLVCESFFYALFPVLVRIVWNRTVRTLLIVLGAGAILVWCMPVIATSVLQTSAYSNPLVRLPEFVVGMCLGVLIRRDHWRGPRLLPALVGTSLGYAAATVNPTGVLAPAAYTLVGFALLIAALARSDIDGRGTWLSSPGMVTLGKVSFAFYVVHLLVLDTVQGLLPVMRGAPFVVAVGGAIAALTVALGFGFMFHHGIEAPLVRLLRCGPPVPHATI